MVFYVNTLYCWTALSSIFNYLLTEMCYAWFHIRCHTFILIHCSLLVSWHNKAYTLTGQIIRYNLFNYFVTQNANQPITWQQLNAFRHLDVVKTTCWSSNRASEWRRKGDLVTLNVEWVVGCQTGLGLIISKTVDLLGFSTHYHL